MLSFTVATSSVVTASWWRHQIETFSALLALCAGNSPVTGEFPTQRPVTPSFDVFFDLRQNEWLSKQSCSWWFETPSCPLWRQSNVHVFNLLTFVMVGADLLVHSTVSMQNMLMKAQTVEKLRSFYVCLFFPLAWARCWKINQAAGDLRHHDAHGPSLYWPNYWFNILFQCKMCQSRWRNQIETSPRYWLFVRWVPLIKAVTQSFAVFFDQCLE